MHKLLPHHSNISTDCAPCVSWKIQRDVIDFHFQFEGLSSLNTNKKFSTHYIDDLKHNWGLWEHDVFEVFISRDGVQYLEVQVSPLGQNFVLHITEPRVEFTVPKSFTGETKTLTISPWHSTISIPICEIPGDSNILTGNCFSIVGEDKRNHFALNTNTETNPDFHRPDLFINFGELI
jgi:hypothetical protein